MYLTIITTALVLTQIIRLIQNTISLKSGKEYNETVLQENKKVKNMNDKQMEIVLKMEEALDQYLGESK